MSQEEMIPRHLLARASDFSRTKNIVGRGSYHTVYQGMDLRQNPPRPVAIRVPCGLGSDDDVKRFRREVSVLAELQHETVIRLIAVVPPGAPGDETMMVFPLMEHGTISSILKKERIGSILPDGWGPTKKSIVIFGTAVGMAYIHSKNVLHRDLKPDSILLNENLEPVISGFTTSRFQDLNMTFNVGSPLFMAPELFNDDGNYTKAIDVFSYGVSLFQMFSDSMAFDDSRGPPRTAFNLLRRVMDGARLARVPEIPDFLWDLITSCWSGKAEDRPSFAAIVNSLRGHVDEWVFPRTDISALREYDARITAGIEF